ncbi:MAG: hypothetical protein U0871_08605 [Gemmataceae bacterium]
MQSLATYSLVRNGASVKEAKQILSECLARVDQWLADKGELADGQLVLLHDGRKAKLTAATYESSLGMSKEWELTEPLRDNPDAEFRTNLQLAQKECGVYLYLTLKAGYRSTTIAPELHIPVKPPRILFDLAKLPGTWQFGAMPVGLKPLMFNANDTEKVIDWLAQSARPMPVVVFSEYEGEIIHPQANWQGKVVERLFGMALVIRFCEDLSWALTQQVGKKWSCYHGAVRIYWPKLDFDSDPFRHDLMIAEDIMGRFRTNDRRTAAEHLLEHLYERFRRISTYSVRCPSVFPELRRASSHERITDLRKQVATKRDATMATANLATTNKRLKEQLTASQNLAAELQKEVKQLELELDETKDELTRVQNEQTLRSVEDKSLSPLVVQQQVQLTTVAEAIERARTEYATDLIFGQDVNDQASRLKEEAGPPTKVFTHLMKLAELSLSLQQAVKDTGKAKLGQHLCDWLTENGANASGEHQKTMEGKGRTQRLWDFGNGSKHVFEKHTKPNEAAPPNQCVRIYFDWCEDRKKIVIGSVGRKPGL